MSSECSDTLAQRDLIPCLSVFSSLSFLILFLFIQTYENEEYRPPENLLSELPDGATGKGNTPLFLKSTHPPGTSLISKHTDDDIEDAHFEHVSVSLPSKFNTLLNLFALHLHIAQVIFCINYLETMNSFSIIWIF